MSRITTTELVNKIYAFCEAYSGIKFFPYQTQFAKRIIRSLLENDGEEITALFARQCLSGDHKILLPGGEKKRIKDIKSGDKVLGFDYDTLATGEVIQSYCAGIQDIYKLVLDGIEILTTREHRFLDWDMHLYKPLYDFEIGDAIVFYDEKTGKFSRKKINNIEFIGKEEVYDIEVMGVESFCVSGILCHNSGKSETVATISGGLAIILPTLANLPMFVTDKRLEMFKEGVLIGIFAPSLHQAQITFNRIKQRLNSRHAQHILKDPDILVDFDTNNGQNFVLTNGSLVSCRSASESSNIEGNSYMLIIVDEAQDVSNFKYLKSISPMGAFYNATKILIGTPSIQKGFFYSSIERNKREYNNGGKRNHFEYNYHTVIKYNSKYEKYINGEKKRLGENSDEFQMSYTLKWLLERGMFIDPMHFEKLGDTSRGISLFDTKNAHVVGIDLGKENDSTVVTVLEVDWANPELIEVSKELNVPDFIVYKKYIKAWLEIQGDNWEEQYAMILDFLKNYRIVRGVMDATGLGSPIYDRLAANVDFELIPYVFTTASKSDLMKHFDAEIKAKRFFYPKDEETQKTIEYRKFTEQMLNLVKTYSGQHMLVSHPPERGAHDDYPYSASLACWGARGEGVEKPVVEKNPFVEVKKQLNHFYSSRNRLTARRR